MTEERLYSLKDDFVIMTEGEAMLLKIKETGTPGFEMYDMTRFQTGKTLNGAYGVGTFA